MPLVDRNATKSISCRDDFSAVLWLRCRIVEASCADRTTPSIAIRTALSAANLTSRDGDRRARFRWMFPTVGSSERRWPHLVTRADDVRWTNRRESVHGGVLLEPTVAYASAMTRWRKQDADSVRSRSFGPAGRRRRTGRGSRSARGQRTGRRLGGDRRHAGEPG